MFVLALLCVIHSAVKCWESYVRNECVMRLPCPPRNCAAGCRSGKDKLLHDVVSLDILPQLVESAAARRRAEEKQAAIEAMPKKRSSRLQVHCIACVQPISACKWDMEALLRAIKDAGSVA